MRTPWSLIARPKKAKILPDTLSHDEMIIFLNSIDTSHLMGLRDRAICELIYSSGMRVSEITSLVFDNIDFDESEIKIVGKGGVERLILFGEDAKLYLLSYINGSRKIEIPN